jgi:hypothetical protein
VRASRAENLLIARAGLAAANNRLGRVIEIADGDEAADEEPAMLPPITPAWRPRILIAIQCGLR